MNRERAKTFIQILELSAKQWFDAEAACDEIIPVLVDDREKEKWRLRAVNYRAQAEIQRAMIEVIREDSES
jgi:hypothetical protein